jgi:hypothetical protein
MQIQNYKGNASKGENRCDFGGLVFAGFNWIGGLGMEKTRGGARGSWVGEEKAGQYRRSGR